MNNPSEAVRHALELVDGHLRSDIGETIRAHITALAAEVEGLRAKTACTMGVGTGGGRLFVHGDYESIKAAQAIVLRAEQAEAKLAACEALPAKWRGTNGADVPPFHPVIGGAANNGRFYLDRCADELDAAMQEKPHE